MSKIIQAAQFAAKCHLGQERKYNSKPYIMHPCRVAGRVATHKDADENAVCAAYLHDVVEDCGVDLYDIEEDFGLAVSAIVHDLTNPSKGSTLPRAERKAMDREHARDIQRISKVIKLIDRIDNLSEIDPVGSFAWLYCDESQALLNVIGDADDSLASELQGLIKAVRDAHIKANLYGFQPLLRRNSKRHIGLREA